MREQPDKLRPNNDYCVAWAAQKTSHKFLNRKSKANFSFGTYRVLKSAIEYSFYNIGHMYDIWAILWKCFLLRTLYKIWTCFVDLDDQIGCIT